MVCQRLLQPAAWLLLEEKPPRTPQWDVLILCKDHGSAAQSYLLPASCNGRGFVAGMWAPVLGMKSMLLPPASSRQLPVRELSHMVVWTNPSTYRLHLWFGHTTKTTWELVPMFGHLIGISGRKPLQETWTWTSLSSITWCWCWACKSRYFPLLSQPSCSPSYSTWAVCSGRVCWEIFSNPERREGAAISSQKPMFICDWELFGCTYYIFNNKLIGRTFWNHWSPAPENKESQILSIEFAVDCSCFSLCYRKH